MSDLIIMEQTGGVTTLTLNRPENRNPLSNAMIAALLECFEAPEVKDAGIVMIRASGTDFCAGGDINDFKGLSGSSSAAQWEACEDFRRMLQKLHDLKPITVAAVKGRALGGGCGLVASCDFAIAAEGSKFGTPEIKIGAFPMVIVPPLVQAIGVRRTMHMSTTGETISAETALEYGLVQQVVPADDFDSAVDEFCKRIGKFSATAFRIGKSTVRSCAEASFSGGLEIGMSMRSIVFSTPEFQEGIEAFLKPKQS